MNDTKEIQFFSIASRWDSTRTLYRGQHATLREALLAALASGASLRDASLRDADLSGASLRGASLRGADLSGADMDNVPVVSDLDIKVEEATRDPVCLDMGSWHKCATTHCRAGWAITLAGDDGKELENKLGPAIAGALIYWKSAGHIPNFYATDAEARADIEQRAGAARAAKV